MSGESAQAAVEAALDELEKARKMLARVRTPQIRNIEHRQFFKAIALSWFNNHRLPTSQTLGAVGVEDIDSWYRRLLDATERASTRSTYIDSVRAARASLIGVRGELLRVPPPMAPSTDSAPDFSPLAADPLMAGILARRWDECGRCIGAQAHLAATVMMGGLLEALLVARANRLVDKSPLFRAKGAPIDTKTKKPLDLRQWMLAAYIDVAQELGWITKSAKDVATVLRDYRNYVHPEKERSHGVTLTADDVGMFWALTKTLALQLLRSSVAAPPNA